MRMNWRALALVLGLCALASLFATGARAQAYIRVTACGDPKPPAGASSGYMDVNGNICTSASVSASILGFTAASVGTPITATTGGVTGTLPAGVVVVAANAGSTNTAYCALGASATTANQPILPGSWFAFTVGASTQLTCITSTSTTTVNMTGGAGVPAGAGGGSSGTTLPTGAATSANQATEIASLATIVTNTGAAIPVGANLIGSVTDTTSGAITNPTSTLTMTSATTAYTAGLLIASNATAGSVVVPSFAIATSAGGAAIQRLRLSTNDATSTAWGGQVIQIDLWNAAPTFTNGDRAAWSPATGTGTHLGAFTCTMSAEYGDGAYTECAPNVGSAALPKLASGTSVFWTLDALTGSGVTGASKVFIITAELLN